MTVDAMQHRTGRPPFDPVSISPLSFWALSAEEREPFFKILRDERPISWHPPIEGTLIPAPVDGVWAVTRNEDIGYVSKNPEIFSLGAGRPDRGGSRGHPRRRAIVPRHGRHPALNPASAHQLGVHPAAGGQDPGPGDKPGRADRRRSAQDHRR